MEREKISVIVPVYQAEKYLTQCLDSIVNQTYKNLEIIAILDGCTDKSIDIIENYAKLDSRIVYKSRENKGVLFTRLEGAKIATGNYITFIDSDDWIEKDMLENLYSEISSTNSDIAKCFYIRDLVETGKKVVPDIPFKEKTIINEKEKKERLYPLFLKTYCFNSMCMQLIKKDLVINILNKNNIDFNVKMAEDLQFNLILYTEAKKIVILPKTFYHYIVNSNSFTSNRTYKYIEKKIKDTINVYSKLLELLPIWKMQEKSYEIVAKKRIIQEALKVFSISYKSMQTKNTKLERKELIELIVSYFNNEELREVAMNDKLAKLIIQKKYFLINMQLTIKITIPELIKKTLKRTYNKINKKGK